MTSVLEEKIAYTEFQKEILDDYYLAHLSRQLSIIARKEVLNGKAKFGIFGDGKEIAQIAFAKCFKNGDWRSGYYRDQTFMFATGMLTPDEFFSLLYGHSDIKFNPNNGGRNFNNHFGTRSLNADGSWKAISKMKNSSSDVSPTAGQMPRSLGLAFASKYFRNVPSFKNYPELSNNGNEVTFCTIGDASTSEGHFWEILNAAGVAQVPLAIAIWDDGYGISVPKEIQTVKASISDAIKGFVKENNSNGILLYKAKGWDYPGLCKMFSEGIEKCRKEHVPVVFHVEEMVQPLGHSTSGSHERYKSAERLAWENEFDPLVKMHEWIIEKGIAPVSELDGLEICAENEAIASRNRAFNAYTEAIDKERKELLKIIGNNSCICANENVDKIGIIVKDLEKLQSPIRKDILSSAKKILRSICNDCPTRKEIQSTLSKWIALQELNDFERYSSYLYIENEKSALNIKEIKPIYAENPSIVNGREIIRDNFDKLFSKYPLLIAFGEDVGKIGGVNQTYEGLQEKYGEFRITDTGIRETAIIGQGIGMAMRGIRPIAEIQYFDYLLFALQTLSDDLATLHWRTCGGQSAPLIISTRGHRLEGVWHSGSPLSMVINSIRGIYVCVPRNMTQAAGFYNTLLEGQDTALVIESLNGYRLKEPMPENIGEFRVPLGIPEIITEGTDVTLVTYGSCVRIAQEAVEQLANFGISVELIDVQTLLPFDLYQSILKSVQKTHKVVFFDEDVPGGATAYMMQKVIEEQDAWKYLDCKPITITAMEHRPAYTTDGDYFSNPNTEDVFDAIYKLMSEAEPDRL
jgi:pyruvate/2-oxoglutarate/acetoin dehydrogenase E1 component/TPP-dependent pyruvate/acetoin dehydrogenase alpha subunit